MKDEKTPIVPDGENDFGPEPEEFHILEYVNILLRRRWLIIAGVFACVIFTGIYFKMQTPVYTASAKFLPSREADTTSRMGQIIGTGQLQSLEGRIPADYYTVLLGSRPFLERMAKKKFSGGKLGQDIDLMTYYKIDGSTEAYRQILAVNAISQSLKVNRARATSAQVSSVIRISYTTSDPDLSAAVVNAFLDEIILYNQDVRESKAKQNRVFIEDQLKETEALLKKAEADLAGFNARNIKIVTSDLQMEKDRLRRNVTVQEAVFIELKKQLELAKIEEQERKPSIEIIERATPPLQKSAPAVRKKVILAGFLALLLFCALAIGLEYLKKIDPDEERTRAFLDNINDIKEDIAKAGRIVGLKKPHKK